MVLITEKVVTKGSKDKSKNICANQEIESTSSLLLTRAFHPLSRIMPEAVPLLFFQKVLYSDEIGAISYMNINIM